MKIKKIIRMFFSLFILGLVYFIWRSQHQLYNPPYSPEINTVLFMAGNNRPELEQVLKRYNKNPADSMKRRAVEFLIVNMPGKYSQGYDAPWEDIMAAYMRLDKIPNRQLRLQAHGLGKMVIKEDMKHITAQYLINNIESAFAVWEKQTWGKDIPFDIFCEEILPYRVGTEPLENWREKALADFADLNSLFHAQPEISIQQACSMVNRQLPSFSGRQIANLPSQNYSMLMTSSKGICYEMTTLALFVMRALGIPVAQDFTQTWPGKDVGHQWNSLYLGNGERISFMGAEFAPGVPHSGITLPKSKVYRITFAEQNNIKTKTENIPPEFQNRFIKDVSTEYGAVDVELPVLYSPSPNLSVPKYVYISAMGSADWNLAGWGEMKDQKLVFRALGKNVLYLPVYYADNTKTVAHYPFFINDEGTIRVFKPDTFNLSKVKLTCVTIPNNWYRMINGFFEGSNKADFSDARVLYTIKDVQQLFNVAKIKNPAKFRYIRYVSPPNSWANVAELEFFGKDKTKLKGTIISSPQRNNDVKQEMAFDDDVLTFFESERNNGGWIGMDMGEKYQIDEIHFIPRNSGDGINLRDTYELYYWDNKGWQLLKSQVATMYDSLYYMSPDNALFCFKNKTKRKGGKVFISQNGEQKWM